VRVSTAYLVIGALSWPLVRVLLRLRAEGLDNLPQGGFVLSANHHSNVDHWAIGFPLFPNRQVRFMGKAELFRPGLGSILRSAGAFPVRRGEHDTAALETAAQLCREGHIVVMFPEGTRRKKGMRKKYEARAHTGAARIALEAGVPLVPAGIVGTDRLGRLAKLRVAYGPPIQLDDLIGREDAPQVATERLMAAIGELERSA